MISNLSPRNWRLKERFQFGVMTELAKEPVATSGGSQVYSSLTQDPKIAPYSPLAVHSVPALKTSWGTYAHLRGGRKKGEKRRKREK